MSKELIIFTDSGDTIIDEATQVFDERGIVTEASFIEGADEVLKTLHEEGYTIALVADGEWESFQNVYRKNGLGYCFDAWVVSEVVGKQKPEPVMFERAYEKLHLGPEDKKRIVMIGNNLKKDIAGANRQGLISVWLDWSPRYFHTVEEADWQPDYTVHTPKELLTLIDRLNKELEKEREEKEKSFRTSPEYKKIDETLSKLISAFCPILYEDDEKFLENMKGHNLAGDDIRRYQHWEWTQGVGLFGIWKLFDMTKDKKYLDILTEFYDKQMEIGFPALNVNTVTPFLTMSFVAEYLQSEKYRKPCKDAAEWIMHNFPRTPEDGFQHLTSDTVNEGELWDDTLFMTVLFLANMGRLEKRSDYIQEAQYQFLIHAKYLEEKTTGLWYHGWSFTRNDNFAAAFWGRGNCWITIAIPEFLSMVECDPAVEKYLIGILNNQAEALAGFQDESGMWHTLVDDRTSYAESSATCGFAYGILKAVHMGILKESYKECARKALKPILSYISEDGVVSQVSYGTPMGRESKDFYKNIELKSMPYGQALAILFLLECKYKQA